MKIKDRFVGIYCHLPFCRSKCAYCDFYSGDFYEFADRYVEAILKEATYYAESYLDLTVSTLYFGGGTPSSLSNDQLLRLISGLRGIFRISPSAEITLEANPATLSEEKLSILSKAGVNRLSIGAQSSDDSELKMLGRLHSYQSFLTTYRLARKYFENISIDVMFGLPDQTVKSFEKTLQEITQLSPEHISLYALKIEEGTRFHKILDQLRLPSEDAVCDMYLLAHKLLTDNGYYHYEISNYAKQDSLSQHNISYWQRKEYIGLGAAAHSYFDGARFANSADISQYIHLTEGNQQPLKSEYTVLDFESRLSEAIMLSLRLTEGLDCNRLFAEFGYDILRQKQDFLNACIQEGYMTLSEDKLSFTPKGFLVSNSVLSELIP